MKWSTIKLNSKLIIKCTRSGLTKLAFGLNRNDKFSQIENIKTKYLKLKSSGYKLENTVKLPGSVSSMLCPSPSCPSQGHQMQPDKKF